MRRILLVLAVISAAIVGAYAIYWHVAANRLAEGIGRWAAERQAEGYEIAYGQPVISGFPRRLEARIEQPVIGSPPASESGAVRWRWAGPELTLHATPWAPLDAHASAPGRHELEIGSGEEARRYVVDATEAVGQASFGADGRVEAASARFTDLLITEDGRDDRNLLAETASIAIAPAAAEGADHTKPSLAFRLALAGLMLPPNAETPLGREVARLELDGAVLGPIEPPRDAAGDAAPGTAPASLRDTLALWRDDGGTLEIARVAADWGPLGLVGNGTFALDAALQPIGAMSTTITGHGAVIDALVAEGTVSARDGSLAKVLLGVLAKPSPVDGTPELTAPLSLQDGYLWVGPAKLLPLPTIVWP